MNFLTVVMRHSATDMSSCELTCIGRTPIDSAKVAQQHAAYEALVKDGCSPFVEVVSLPTLEGHPDCMFVEDVAVVVNECAVLTRPGVASRQGEVQYMAATLKNLRGEDRVFTIEAPGTIDGGDTLVVGKYVFVGKSTRTNVEGFSQLRSFLQPFGYTCIQLTVQDCMHLKCAATALNNTTVFLNTALLPKEAFTECGLAVVESEPSEGDGSNVLSFFDFGTQTRTIVVAQAYPKCKAIIESWAARITSEKIVVKSLQVDEVAKAEGALTCCSLLVYRSK